MRYKLRYSELRCTIDGRNAFYKMAVVDKADGKAVLVKNWGKIGAVGQFAVENGSRYACLDSYNKTFAEKTSVKKGYVERDSWVKESDDVAEIEAHLARIGMNRNVFSDEELSVIDVDVLEPAIEIAEEEPEVPTTSVKHPDDWGAW